MSKVASTPNSFPAAFADSWREVLTARSSKSGSAFRAGMWLMEAQPPWLPPMMPTPMVLMLSLLRIGALTGS